MHDIFRLAHDVKMSASDTAEVRLYGEIIQNMPDDWKWDENDSSASDFDKAIKEVRESGARKLLLRINSPGGIVTEAVAMRSILMSAGFSEINIRIEGLCASAATMVASIPSAHVEITEGSEYMIHNPWLVAAGNANDLEHAIERLRNIEQTSRAFYSKKSKQSDAQIKEWMDAETWFTAEQAVEYGFADELIADEAIEMPAAACVTSHTYAAMKGLYKSIPKEIAVQDEEQAESTETEVLDETTVSNESSVAGPSTENKSMEEEHMDIKELTIEQLRDGNPDLFNQVKQSAIADERERIDTIDALTLSGYEEMAAEAKTNGTSAIEFQKQIVAAQKKKGAEFLEQRKEETKVAEEVTGGEPVMNTVSEEEEIRNAAKEIAESAARYSGVDNGMF